MKNIIKRLSLAVLICFAITNLCQGTNVIKNKITLTPVSPVFYENNIGIETPTIDQEFKLHIETRYNDVPVMNVRIANAGPFQVISSEKEMDGEIQKGNVFTLKAPETEGIYTITFEGKNQEGRIFNFETEIEVVEYDSFQAWVRAGTIIGLVVITVATIMLLSGSGK